MYKDTTLEFADRAAKKFHFLQVNPLGFLLSAIMAGAYVGIGIILILTLGNEADPMSAKLIMGCFFGITLTLVIFAGAELFSGHIMFMTFGFLHGKVRFFEAIRDWTTCWWGNLLGAIMLSVLFILGGGGGWADDSQALIHSIADHKINSTVVELLARGIICNWLICLAIWMASRTNNDTAKCILIFWCLFAFVAAGFEHGVANMTVFTISYLGAHSDSVTMLNMLYNLLVVSVGNIIGGVGFIGVAYYLTSHKISDMGSEKLS